jgi:hypothetical protein
MSFKITEKHIQNVEINYHSKQRTVPIEKLSIFKEHPNFLKIGGIAGSVFLMLGAFELGIPTYGVAAGFGIYCLYRKFSIKQNDIPLERNLSKFNEVSNSVNIISNDFDQDRRTNQIFSNYIHDMDDEIYSSKKCCGMRCGRGVIKDDQKNDIDIALSYMFDGFFHHFYAYISENDQIVFLGDRGYVGEISLFDRHASAGNNYPGTSEKLSCLEINWLNSEIIGEKKYSGLGTLLVNTAFEASIRLDFEGRVTVPCPFSNILGFYWKLGLRFEEDSLNERVEKAVSDAKKTNSIPDTKSIPSELMFLPLAESDNKKRIAQLHPLLYPSLIEPRIVTYFPYSATHVE